MNTNPIKFVHITVWVKHYLTDWQTVRVTSEHALLVWLNVFQKKDLTSKLSLTKHLSGLKVWKFKSYRRFEQQQLGNLDIFKNAKSLKMFSGKTVSNCWDRIPLKYSTWAEQILQKLFIFRFKKEMSMQCDQIMATFFV